MNDVEAKLVRLYQYLLAKEVYLRQNNIDLKKQAQRINAYTEDIYLLWYNMIKLEVWEEFSHEVWNILE